MRAVIERCLEKEPGRRYQRTGEVRAAVEALQTGAVAPWGNRRFVRPGGPGWAWPAGAAVAVAALLAAFDVGGSAHAVHWRTADTPRIESLAVLPLENLSGDAAQDYFAVGMTETLITDLTGSAPWSA